MDPKIEFSFELPENLKPFGLALEKQPEKRLSSSLNGKMC